MLHYAGRRLLTAVVVVWAAFTVSFAIVYLLPSDPVALMLSRGGDANLDEAAVADLRHELGFDRPLIVQYLTRLWAAVHGDLGTSMQTGRPVVSTLVQAFPQTAALSGVALLLAVVGALLLATAAQLTPLRWVRALLLALPPVGRAVPTFWIGLVLLQVFSFQLHLFPATGNDGWRTLVLPALTLSVPAGVVLAQVLVQSFGSTWQAPFVEILRAKGLRTAAIQFRHVLRHALAPMLTILGVLVGAMLSGSIVTETVFSRSGVGQLTQQAVTMQDLPMVQAVVVLAAVLFSITNLVVDLIHPIIDPRVLQRSPGTGRRRVS